MARPCDFAVCPLLNAIGSRFTCLAQVFFFFFFLSGNVLFEKEGWREPAALFHPLSPQYTLGALLGEEFLRNFHWFCPPS